MYVTRGKDSEMVNMATEGNNNKTAMTFQQIHDRLGHMSNATTRETAKTTRFAHQEDANLPMRHLRSGKGQAEEHQASRNNKTKDWTTTGLPGHCNN